MVIREWEISGYRVIKTFRKIALEFDILASYSSLPALIKEGAVRVAKMTGRTITELYLSKTKIKKASSLG